jgi:pilus assembly protein Flp/PilA
MKLVKAFIRNEDGTETVEWAIMIGLIAVASIALIYAIGIWVQGKFQALGEGLSDANSAPAL